VSDRLLDVDQALTAGYARAHALEGEWLRIERGGDPSLAGRQREVEAMLVDLRASLAQLRTAADRARAAYEAAQPVCS
jgi:hypothetical protein